MVKKYKVSNKCSGSRKPDEIHPEFARVLVQRAALTMHTAFNRQDNTHPAPVTAIAPSK